jgi:hypothetical protein
VSAVGAAATFLRCPAAPGEFRLGLQALPFLDLDGLFGGAGRLNRGGLLGVHVVAPLLIGPTQNSQYAAAEFGGVVQLIKQGDVVADDHQG